MDAAADLQTIPVLRSPNLKQTQDFYARLGFVPETFGETYLILRRAGLELHFCPPDHDDGRANESSCYIRGGSIDALHAEWFPAGLVSPFYHRPWGMYEFYLSDPHGCLLKFGRADDEGARPANLAGPHRADRTA